jgi:glycosyltransferase involved in cell wall biosynthesis
LRLVKNLQLEKHVLFLNKFIDTEDLFKYLSAADVYITPYLNEAQITSGTLSYAVGVGLAVISTPYWHALELLAEGMGRLFNFNDSTRLTSSLTELLDKPDELKNSKEKHMIMAEKLPGRKRERSILHLLKKFLKPARR